MCNELFPSFYTNKKQLRVLVRGLSRWCGWRRCRWCWGWINSKKSSNNIFETHSPKRSHSLAPFWSHTNESSFHPYLSLSTGSVFSSNCPRGEQERVGWFVPPIWGPKPTLLRLGQGIHGGPCGQRQDESPWLRVLVAAVSQRTGRFWGGEKRGFFLEIMFFFSAGKGKIHLVSQEKQCGMKTEMKVADGSLQKWMLFFLCHDVQLDFSLAHCWPFGFLVIFRQSDVAIAANLFVNSQDDEWFSNNRTRVYNAAWPLKNIGNRFPKFHSNE